MIPPDYGIFRFFVSDVYGVPFIISLIIINVVTFSCYLGIKRARGDERRLLALRLGPVMLICIGASIIILFLILFIYSPQKPGVFCSMRLDLEGMITLNDKMGLPVHTGGFDPNHQPFYRQKESYGILVEGIQANPYVHYVNPFLTYLMLGCAGVCGGIALIWFGKNQIIGIRIRPHLKLNPEEQEICERLKKSIDWEE